MSSPDWARWRRGGDVAGYDERWRRMAAAGHNPDGEADLVAGYAPRAVLDAGCGTGRVAIELASRGVDVVGVDVDTEMLAVARAKAPELRTGGAIAEHGLAGRATAREPDGDGVRGRSPQGKLSWVEADLARLDLGRRFDVVVLAGNVLLFVAEPDRRATVAACARHLEAGGRLINGFQLAPGGPTLAELDRWAAASGLALEDRFATWERAPLSPDGSYAVSVHCAAEP